MKNFVGLSIVAAVACVASAAQADTLNYNSAPADGWFFGSGNDYSPANTAVLSTDAGSQLYLRMHETFMVAPASDASGLYSFSLGATNMSFDWGVDNNAGGFDNVGINLTMTNVGTSATFSYSGLLPGNDNEAFGGSLQNSARLNWFPIGYDGAVDGTYMVTLDVTGLAGGDKSLSVYAQIGAGAGAVPEPATWGMMILGLGAVGGALRTRKRAAVRFV